MWLSLGGNYLVMMMLSCNDNVLELEVSWRYLDMLLRISVQIIENQTSDMQDTLCDVTWESILLPGVNVFGDDACS